MVTRFFISSNRFTLHALNAFRHQRYFHPVHCLPLGPARSSAQRLSASKVLSPNFGRFFGARFESAQRLSASKVLSPRAEACVPHSGWPVLNAFRHQRYFHPLDE